MNILLLNHYAGSPEMGMEFRPYYFAREWVRMGHKVTIVAGDYSHLRQKNPKVEKDFFEQNVDGITYVWVRTGSYEGNGAARAFSMFRFVGKLLVHAKALVQRYRPDAVIASSTYPLDTYAAQRISHLSGAKYVHEVHDMWPSTLYEVGGMSKRHPFVQLMQVAEDSAYANCDKCVSILSGAKDYMVEHGLRDDEFVCIQNGIVTEDWEDNQPLPLEHRELFDRLQSKFIVGYAGGFAIANALDILLDAAAHISNDDIEFVLVGRGVERDRLISRKYREQLANVHFLPAVEKTLIPSVLREFDCCFMGGLDSPLYRFGISSNKMYDYMMAGKPVIHAVNIKNTLIGIYNCGVEVDPNPIENVVAAISTLYHLSDEELHKMGERGRIAVLNNFNYKLLSSLFIDALK